MRKPRMLPGPRRDPTRLFLPLLVLAACGGDAVIDPGRAEPIDLAREWEVATPASQGIDADRLQAAAAHARTLPRMLSLLVVRHGKLVLEEYYNGNEAAAANDVRSITKTVVSTLVGIAVEQGFLPGVDVPISRYLEPGFDLSPDQEAITIRDLLTMSGGFEWDESTSLGYNRWILSGNWIGYVLRRPIVDPPGQVFNYNSGAAHLLSVVLQVAARSSIQDFAGRYLFGPLAFRDARWEMLPDGFANGASGIDLRPRDLARLGVLWLQDGMSGTKRILPAGWAEEGTTPAFAWWTGSPPFRDQSYGFLWWLTRSTPPGRAWIAWGHGGQFIYVVPTLDVVVVVTTEWRAAGSQIGVLAPNGLDLIINRVLPAVR